MPAKLLTSGLLIATLLMLGGCHQLRGDAVDRLIIGEVMTNSAFAENLRALCLPGGRLSGTPNARQAEQFVADRCRAYGLANVHFEPFEMTGWQVNETAVTVLSTPPVTLEGAVALRNTQSTPADGITADLIDVGDGREEDFEQLGDALRGKFALVRDGGPQRSDKMRYARAHAAAGLVVVSRPERGPIIGNCHPAPRPEPGIVIRHDDGEKLAEVLAAGEAVRLNVKVQADIWDATPRNVVADLPGRGRRAHEIVILCAHLDSWHLAEGAIDNGNGAATILETARALTTVGWTPRRTVRFIWFMAEEQDLYGSKAYVAAHADELHDVVAVVNVDMPGAPRTFATSGSGQLTEFLQKLRGHLRGYELNEEIRTLRGGFSDHAPFLKAGVPTVTLWGDIGPGGQHYHTTGDKYEIVDRRATVQTAAVLGVLLRQLADRPTRPARRPRSSPST